MQKQECRCENGRVERIGAVAIADGQGDKHIDQDGGGMACEEFEGVLLYEVVQHLVGEYAAIGDANEEQDLFDGKVERTDPCNILFIESPNALSGENAVPDKEEHRRKEQGREEGFPFCVELQPSLK